MRSKAGSVLNHWGRAASGFGPNQNVRTTLMRGSGEFAMASFYSSVSSPSGPVADRGSMRLLMLIFILLAVEARAQEAPHDPFTLYGNTLQFEVYRKGVRIGQYQAIFSRR